MISYPENAISVNYIRNIISPSFEEELSGEERKFINEYLEKNDDVVWWYRNGVKTELAFSLAYKDDNGETKNFFPDFIVQYSEGTLGIFDTKKGFTLTEGRPKHRALTQFLDAHAKIGDIKVIGGFIQSQGEQNITFYKTISDDYQVDGLQGWEKLQ